MALSDAIQAKEPELATETSVDTLRGNLTLLRNDNTSFCLDSNVNTLQCDSTLKPSTMNLLVDKGSLPPHKGTQ